MSQANIGLWVFQYNKVTDGIQMHMLAGYGVFATNAPIRQNGGVAVF